MTNFHTAQVLVSQRIDAIRAEAEGARAWRLIRRSGRIAGQPRQARAPLTPAAGRTTAAAVERSVA
jgi:hypothetical protein